MSLGKLCVRFLLIALMVTAVPNLVQARDDHLGWQVGLKSVFLFHEEKQVSGDQLLTEQGWMPGLFGQLDWCWDERCLLAQAEWLRGPVNYYGQTQLGQQANTETREDIIDVRIVGSFPTIKDNLHGYIGLGHHIWQRDILSSQVAMGIDEYYQWSYLLGGFSYVATVLNRDFQISGSVKKSFNETLDVQFKSVNHATSEIKLPSGVGVAFDIKKKFALSKGISVSVGPEFSMWMFDRSDAFPLRENGITVGNATQPEFKHYFAGLSVSFSK
ncbi:MAG: hypothetical protein HQL54_14375 [Magnetococcales bacterium]|nr:hypothetical protein [Magnetococcales bacterium]